VCMRRVKTRDLAPLSEVWKDNGRGRFRMLERETNVVDGEGRLSKRMAAIVC